MPIHKAMLYFITFIVVTQLPTGLTSADTVDVSLSLSVEMSKSYYDYYRVGLLATIHNVTVSGRLLNTSSGLGIAYQNILVCYKNVSDRTLVQNGNWTLINNTSTDVDGYYSYVWIPPARSFLHPEQHEVIYQVEVVWKYGDFSAQESRDVYISNLEYQPPYQGPLIIYILQPFLITGLFLSGATGLTIVVFNRFGGAERKEGKIRLDRKNLLYFLLYVGLLFALWLPSLLVQWIPVQWHAFVSFLPFAAIPIVSLLLSIPLFFRYLRRGAKLKTTLCSIVITWATILVLIFASAIFPLISVYSLFFPPANVFGTALGPVILVTYLIPSEGAILTLFLLLIFLKEKARFSQPNSINP